MSIISQRKKLVKNTLDINKNQNKINLIEKNTYIFIQEII
jgi:hypothetical protein